MLDHIKKQQELQKSKIAGLYGTESNDIEKGGKGSGRKIGTTKSGKPVYSDKGAKHEVYNNFTQQDHKDASSIHQKIINGKGAESLTDSQYERHRSARDGHSAQEFKKEAEIKKSESTSIEQHNAILKSRIANSIGGESISDEELEKSASDFLEKGSRGEPIGTQKTFGGRNYIKTSTGWKYHGKGTGAKAQEHAKAAVDSKYTDTDWNHGLKRGDKVRHQGKEYEVLQTNGNNTHLWSEKDSSFKDNVHVAHLYDNAGNSYARNVDQDAVAAISDKRSQDADKEVASKKEDKLKAFSQAESKEDFFARKMKEAKAKGDHAGVIEYQKKMDGAREKGLKDGGAKDGKSDLPSGKEPDVSADWRDSEDLVAQIGDKVKEFGGKVSHTPRGTRFILGKKQIVIDTTDRFGKQDIYDIQNFFTDAGYKMEEHPDYRGSDMYAFNIKKKQATNEHGNNENKLTPASHKWKGMSPSDHAAVYDNAKKASQVTVNGMLAKIKDSNHFKNLTFDEMKEFATLHSAKVHSAFSLADLRNYYNQLSKTRDK